MRVERCTAWMCGLKHVREAIPFPRMLYRLKPQPETKRLEIASTVLNLRDRP
jgi:hypothetical protein